MRCVSEDFDDQPSDVLHDAESIAIRIHFSHCADENMLPQPRIFHWVIPECKVTVIVCDYSPLSHVDTDVLFLVDIFQQFATYCVSFVENRADLML
ncbi:hypothetical protein TNCV_797561 [Trichonephila clavipes]|nr:hypothetical protein TNCV_797561 [Trichonephila clavipes]